MQPAPDFAEVWLILIPVCGVRRGAVGVVDAKQFRNPSICLLQDLCLAPSLGALAEPACPRAPLKLAQRGTVKRLWPQQLHSLQVLEVLVQNGDWAGLGSRRLRGFLHTPDPGGAHASHIRTRSASTTATWTSSGSTPLSELAWGVGAWLCARPEASGSLHGPRPTLVRPPNLP